MSAPISNPPRTAAEQSAGNNLTHYEMIALGAPVGVSDGHPRQSPSPGQRRILDRISDIWDATWNEPFDLVERRAQRAFLDSTRQFAAPTGTSRVLSCYSSSVAMDVLARCLADHAPRIGLVHPTFDNIPDLLRGRAVELWPLDENEVYDGRLPPWVGDLDAVFLTTPNNPTGRYVTAEALLAIAETCRRHGIVLALDVCFRGFDTRFQYDTYDLLDRVGVEYVLIEDTGKLWPTSELKLGFLGSSPSWAPVLHEALSDLALSVSPFVLGLVEALARDAAAGGYTRLHRLVRRNRAAVSDALAATPARVLDPDSRISVCRVALPAGVDEHTVYRDLIDRGVHVLPCAPFSWADADDDSGTVRVALGRDPAVVDLAAARLAEYFGAGDER